MNVNSSLNYDLQRSTDAPKYSRSDMTTYATALIPGASSEITHIANLQFPQTPYLGVHETGSRPVIRANADLCNSAWLPESYNISEDG